MNLRECYEAFDGDYEGTMSRIPNEDFIKKLVIKARANTDFEKMLEAIDNKNWEDAFRLSHTIKGVAANLGFSDLCETSTSLCEYFRNGAPTEDFSECLQKTKTAHEKVCKAIAELE